MPDIAICSDNIPELEQLSAFVKGFVQDRPELLLRVRRFQSLYDLVDVIKLGEPFQISLLDHRGGEPWMNGLSAEALLRDAAPELSIVGFTGDIHAAFLSPAPGDPLGLEARLAKPVSSIDLFSVLDRLIRRLPQSPDPALELPTEQGPRLLPFVRLVRAHYRDHVVTCHMADGETVKSSVLRLPFSQLIQPLLQTGGFCWLSASCVVNLAFLEELDRQTSSARMSDGAVLKVPKAAFPGLRESFEKYRKEMRKIRAVP